eukprot:NODE_232_length_2879_cov_87.179971_g216_i0.p1 GENE.NODE_232_length_2879_cov_87.179971_g216_i0~~NODE_232_length_2879_cov_87.179971_g216_i0.p1  ORF type:complete len:700 (-),score=109.74 NODE_232_length_2879_cov_87.179971_g216_i0:155-2254(-)
MPTSAFLQSVQEDARHRTSALRSSVDTLAVADRPTLTEYRASRTGPPAGGWDQPGEMFCLVLELEDYKSRGAIHQAEHQALIHTVLPALLAITKLRCESALRGVLTKKLTAHLAKEYDDNVVELLDQIEALQAKYKETDAAWHRDRARLRTAEADVDVLRDRVRELEAEHASHMNAVIARARTELEGLSKEHSERMRRAGFAGRPVGVLSSVLKDELLVHYLHDLVLQQQYASLEMDETEVRARIAQAQCEVWCDLQLFEYRDHDRILLRTQLQQEGAVTDGHRSPPRERVEASPSKALRSSPKRARFATLLESVAPCGSNSEDIQRPRQDSMDQLDFRLERPVTPPSPGPSSLAASSPVLPHNSSALFSPTPSPPLSPSQDLQQTSTLSVRSDTRLSPSSTPPPPPNITCVCVLSDGSVLTGAADGSVKWWTGQGEYRGQLGDDGGPWPIAAVTEVGLRVWTGDVNGDIRVWQPIGDGYVLHTFIPDDSGESVIAILAESGMVHGVREHTVTLHGPNSAVEGRAGTQEAVQHAVRVEAFLCAASNRQVEMWDASNLEPVGVLECDKDIVGLMARGDMLLTLEQGGRILQWDLEHRTVKRALGGFLPGVVRCSLLRETRVLVISTPHSGAAPLVTLFPLSDSATIEAPQSTPLPLSPDDVDEQDGTAPLYCAAVVPGLSGTATLVVCRGTEMQLLGFSG